MPGIKKIPMDGFTGALMAVESFDGTATVLHGPGGCRNYHTFLSSQCYSRRSPENFRKYSQKYFYWNSRMPCTYMDENDYINGAESKIEEILPIVKEVDGGVAVFIQSPGAALIGDNISDMIERLGYADSALVIEESLISRPFSSSYDHTVRSIIEWKGPERTEVRKGAVNILGLPITTKAWADSLEELRSMLALCGIEVLTSPGAGCSVNDIGVSANAEYNVMVCPEYGLRTAEYYERRFRMRCIRPEAGAPVGFDASEGWIKNICKVMGKDPSPALEYIGRQRLRAFNTIDKLVYNQKTKGMRFAVMADSSVLLPLTKWLYSYLSMIPVFLEAEPGEDQGCMKALNAFIESKGLRSHLEKDISRSEPYFVFADGHMSETLRLMDVCKAGVDISAPDLSHFSFIPKPVMGALGSMYILDEIFNSL
ncbi:MAG: nitrogenase component 1 [Candidatus Methanoplasma sp.]|jgi:nitrogenase molybdenum-iron protein alpha/beta subunit|nr:nitrogenase component 1 [Candidatus Methanoplasma sp.]